MLGLIGATALVAGGMVGGGILLLPSIMGVFGTWSIFGWMLATLMTYSIAKVFGRLSKTFKGGDGPMQYIGETFGSNYGFLAGWGYFFGMCFSGSLVATALGNYALPLIGCDFIPGWMIGSGVIALLFLLNMFSAGSANGLLVVLTFIKIAFFGLIAIVGMKNVGAYQVSFGPATDLFKSASLAMFAFLGVEFASLASGSIKNPEKNVARATNFGLIIASLIFIGVHCAVLFVLPDVSASSRPVYDAAEILFGDIGAILISIVAIVSGLSTLNGMLIVEANTAKAVSVRGWASKNLSKTNKQGFAWVGGLIFCTFTLFILAKPIFSEAVVCILANSLVGMVYLFSTLVDAKKSGWDIHNVLACISSLLILYNVNMFVLLVMIVLYLLGFVFKKLTGKKIS